MRPISPDTFATHEVSGFQGFLETVKPVLPPVLMFGILPIMWLMFRDTWRVLDDEALRHRALLLARGKTDTRPMVALVMCAMILTLQEYYGGRVFFDAKVFPLLRALDTRHPTWIHLDRYTELWTFVWWAGTRIAGYVLVPFPLWKLIFRQDSLLDLGLRTKGFFSHVWIYVLFLAIVLPAMLIVARSPDFGAYYPFYKQSSRSWFDFLLWEAMYFLQFLALEMFFRGFWLGALRKSLGSGAIFAMAVPYCMIHYGKPYLEACGAILAGIALGSIAMRTKSIYQGFLVHITVAGLMDWLSLSHRHAMPTAWFPPSG